MNQISNTNNSNFIYLLYIKQHVELKQRDLFSSSSEYDFYYHATVSNIAEKLQQYQKKFQLGEEWTPRFRMYKILQKCQDLYSLSIVPTYAERPQIIYARRTSEAYHYDEIKENAFFKFSLPVISSTQIKAFKEEGKQELEEHLLNNLRTINIQADSSEKGCAIAELSVEWVKYILDFNKGLLSKEEFNQKKNDLKIEFQKYGIDDLRAHFQVQMQRYYLSSRREFTYFLFPSRSFSRNSLEGHEFTPVLEKCKKIKTFRDVNLNNILGMRDETKVVIQKLITHFLRDLHAKEIAVVALLPLTERAVVLRFSKNQ